MNELTEQAKDGSSKGEFVEGLSGLFNAIPSSSPTMAKEDNPLASEDDNDDPLNTDDEKGDEEIIKPDDSKDVEEEDSGDDDGGNDEDDEDDDDNEPTIIDDLATEFGDVDFGDNTEFENEADAVKVYVKRLIENKGQEFGQKAIKGLFKQMPEVEALVEHLSQGYGLDSFLKEKQPEVYSPLDLDDASDEEKESVIKQAWKLKGMEDDEIEDALEVTRDSGKLDTRAASAQKFLKTKHDELVNKVKEQEAKTKAEEEAKWKETQTQLNSFLDSGKLIDGTVTLDKTKTAKLKDFIFGSKDGESIREAAWGNLSLDKQLVLDYLVATDFKDLKLNSDPVKSKIIKNIKIKKTGATRVKIDNSDKKGDSSAPFDVKNFFNQVNN